MNCGDTAVDNAQLLMDDSNYWRQAIGCTGCCGNDVIHLRIVLGLQLGHIFTIVDLQILLGGTVYTI